VQLIPVHTLEFFRENSAEVSRALAMQDRFFQEKSRDAVSMASGNGVQGVHSRLEGSHVGNGLVNHEGPPSRRPPPP